MADFLIRELETNNIEKELFRIGFDNSYINKASSKFNYRNLKIYKLTPAQANILKQTAISVGADCATNKEVITGNIEFSNVILGGSISQLKKIAQKLTFQPFSLKILSEELLKYLDYKNNKKSKIVGILNITPDSFSDGGQYINPTAAIEQLYKLIEDGADIIDIGAESTRPNSNPVDCKTQIERLSPIIKEIQKITVPISLDTRSSIVAKYGLDNGVKIINDTSGFDYDSKMIDVISEYQAEIILQHSLSTPDVMQNNPMYEDIVEEIYLSLKNKIDKAHARGINNIIIDPGIGFGKNRTHNFEILDRIHEFYSLNTPIMVGISRKSFLGLETNDNNLKDAVSLAVSYPLVKKGVDYLRVHNVKLFKQLLNMVI